MRFSMLWALLFRNIECSHIARVLDEARNTCVESMFRCLEFFENNLVIFGTVPTEIHTHFAKTLPKDVQCRTEYITNDELKRSKIDPRVIRQIFVEGFFPNKNMPTTAEQEQDEITGFDFGTPLRPPKQKCSGISFISKSQYEKRDLSMLSEVFVTYQAGYFWEDSTKIHRFKISIAHLIDLLEKSVDETKSKIAKVSQVILRENLHKEFYKWSCSRHHNTGTTTYIGPWCPFRRSAEWTSYLNLCFVKTVLTKVDMYFPNFFDDYTSGIYSSNLPDEDKYQIIASMLGSIRARIDNANYTHIVMVLKHEEAENLSSDMFLTDSTVKQFWTFEGLFTPKPRLHCYTGRIYAMELYFDGFFPHVEKEAALICNCCLEMDNLYISYTKNDMCCRIERRGGETGIVTLHTLVQDVDREISVMFPQDLQNIHRPSYEACGISLLDINDPFSCRTLFGRYSYLYRWDGPCFDELFTPFYGDIVLSRSSKTKKIPMIGYLDGFNFHSIILDQITGFVRNLRKTSRTSKYMYFREKDTVLGHMWVESLEITKQLDALPYYFDLKPRISEEEKDVFIFDIYRVTSAFIHCKSPDGDKLCAVTVDIIIIEINFIKIHFDKVRKILCIEISQSSSLLQGTDSLEPDSLEYSDILEVINDTLAHFLSENHTQYVIGENLLNMCLRSARIPVKDSGLQQKYISSYKGLHYFIAKQYPEIPRDDVDCLISFKIAEKCGDIHLSVRQTKETQK